MEALTVSLCELIRVFFTFPYQASTKGAILVALYFYRHVGGDAGAVSSCMVWALPFGLGVSS